MKINKKLLAVIMTLVIGSAALTGCGQKTEQPSVTPTESPAVDEVTPTETPVVDENAGGVTGEEVTGETDPTPAQETYFVAVDGIEMPAGMAMDSTMFADTYGIDTSLLNSYYVQMPMMNVHATEVAVFELKDAKDADKVMAGIEKRQKALVDQWKSYLPEQLELVENYKTAQKDNMILFVISPEADQIVQKFESAK